MLHDARGSAELSLHDPSLQLEAEQDLQSDTESTPSHAAARQEAREEQQMDTPDPAHQHESRQERQRRLNRVSQARHRKKRTVSSMMYSFAVAECGGLSTTDMAPKRAQGLNRDAGCRPTAPGRPLSKATLMQTLIQLLCHGPRESAKACRGRFLSCKSS